MICQGVEVAGEGIRNEKCAALMFCWNQFYMQGCYSPHFTLFLIYVYGYREHYHQKNSHPNVDEHRWCMGLEVPLDGA